MNLVPSDLWKWDFLTGSPRWRTGSAGGGPAGTRRGMNPRRERSVPAPQPTLDFTLLQQACLVSSPESSELLPNTRQPDPRCHRGEYQHSSAPWPQVKVRLISLCRMGSFLASDTDVRRMVHFLLRCCKYILIFCKTCAKAWNMQDNIWKHYSLSPWWSYMGIFNKKLYFFKSKY